MKIKMNSMMTREESCTQIAVEKMAKKKLNTIEITNNVRITNRLEVKTYLHNMMMQHILFSCIKFPSRGSNPKLVTFYSECVIYLTEAGVNSHYL